MKKDKQILDEYISPLYVNGLSGRVLHIPRSSNSKEIMFIYGHHSTIERWRGLIQDLSQYGSVTVPDLPGFGGMESLNKIGIKPSVDSLADYLASYIKMRYKRKRITIIGLSFGFVVVTRMLQKYPDLTSKVDMLISVVGFAHYDDFLVSNKLRKNYALLSRFLSNTVAASVFRHTALLSPVIRLVYAKTPNAKHKFEDANGLKFKHQMDMEVNLWHQNDVSTHWATTAEMLWLDNCKTQVKLPVWHVAVKGEKYFDNHRVEQHFRVIFSDVTIIESSMGNHAPTVVADIEESRPLIPDQLRELLSS